MSILFLKIFPIFSLITKLTQKWTYNKTVLNYINSLKIREAKALLRESKLSVTEISEKLGFNSIHYFSRLFKKTTGHSPKEYIRSIRSKFDL